MSRALRVLWGEGMFLRPQHFQQQALFVEARMAEALRMVHAYPWGVISADINHDALAAGTLHLNQLQAVFQDGTHFAAPSADPLPLTRDLRDLPQIGVETIVYACLYSMPSAGIKAAMHPMRVSRFASTPRMSMFLIFIPMPLNRKSQRCAPMCASCWNKRTATATFRLPWRA